MLAIVIPYFRIRYFEETLKSLAQQTDSRFKVYIGNDASPDSPIAILEKYQSQLDITYFEFEENIGNSSLKKHWDRCIARTRDEPWIMILGDDDYLEETLVAQFYNQYQAFENKTNLVRFATKVINEKKQSVSNLYTHPQWESAAASFYRRFQVLTRSTLSEYVFSKESYCAFGFQDFPLAWHSDDYAWLDFTNKNPIFSINESCVFIRISEYNISGSASQNNLKKAATEQFYTLLITCKLDLFDQSQRLDLLMAFEIAIKNNRDLKWKEWIFLTKLYLSDFKIIPLIKFLRRFVIGISK